MARPLLNETERRAERLTVRFRPAELEELLKQAEISGLSISELIRKQALGKHVATIADLKLLSELRRIGGLVKHIFNESNGLYSKKTAAILNELHAAVIRVAQMGTQK